MYLQTHTHTKLNKLLFNHNYSYMFCYDNLMYIGNEVNFGSQQMEQFHIKLHDLK